MRRLLVPEHVAFFGGRAAEVAAAQCLKAGFKGQVSVVNPNRERMAGLACLRRVADLPRPPDACFIAVPARQTVDLAQELSRYGAGGCVCYAAGFAESGPEGEALQQALVAAAGDMALVGPNCYGLLNYLDGVTLWPDNHGGGPVDRGVAIISQSGNVSMNLTMNRRGLPIAYMMSLGNQAGTGVAAWVEELAGDPRVSAIGVFIEGLQDPQAFSAAAAGAHLGGTPVVALKYGTSALGAAIALSHTRSLAGSDALYRALFRRSGVIPTSSLTGFLETLKIVHQWGLRPGKRLISLSCSGGEASLVADHGTRLGMAFPPIPEPAARALRALLPHFVTIGNPFDYNTSIWGREDDVGRCFRHALAGPFDVAMLVLDFPVNTDKDDGAWYEAMRAFADACEANQVRGILVASLHELQPASARAYARERGLVPMLGLEDCLEAVRAVADTAADIVAGPSPVRSPLALNTSAATKTLDEWDSKQRLRAAGLTVPDGIRTRPEEAVAAAKRLGYPVVIKVLGTELVHKSDVGAVITGCRDEASVAAAVARLESAGAQHGFGLQQVLVEKMVPDAVCELIVGVSYDPQFGHSLVLGAGGVLVALMEDSVTLLQPVDRAQVAAALQSLKVNALLRGFRGGRAGDKEALVDAVMAVAGFTAKHQNTLLEMDINPLMVLPEGRGVVATDAWIRTVE